MNFPGVGFSVMLAPPSLPTARATGKREARGTEVGGKVGSVQSVELG